jgi:hypothetical protein
VRRLAVEEYDGAAVLVVPSDDSSVAAQCQENCSYSGNFSNPGFIAPDSPIGQSLGDRSLDHARK